MRVDLEIDIGTLKEGNPKDGQISVKLPKEQEIRFKTLNTRHQKKLSGWMREFALKLMDQVEESAS